MQRTNIYLDERQLALLKSLAERRGESVATLVRNAVDEWLTEQGAHEIEPEEWERRFDALLARRSASAREHGLDEKTVDREVMAAVREVREARAASRR